MRAINMNTTAFLFAACLAAGTALADDRKPAAAQGSSSAGATTEKSRTAGGVSEDLLKEFRGLDADKDGLVSKPELTSEPALGKLFSKADKDRDGKLDPAEYRVLKAEAFSKGGE